ncbi:MAG: DEAD/DEAH box helicase, partial [Armatimonadia bacterium]
IILHAGYLAGELVLWGEKPVEPGGVVLARRGRQPRVPKPLPSPYDAGASAVSEALQEAAGLKLGPAQAGVPTVVWLPTVAGKPAANEALIADRPDPEAPVSLAPWVVSGLALAPQQWVDLLCRCGDQHTLAPGVIVGYDLRYWATALRFAGALVARQQFLPGLRETEGEYRACWEPLITGPEVERLSQLARAMPPACRALAKERAPAPQAAAREVLASGVSYLLDPLVRRAATTTGGVGQTLRRKPGASEILHDQWLSALRAADGAMAGNARELEEFADQVRTWRRPLAATAAAPFRLCFRLEDPGASEPESGLVTDLPGTGASWHISYLLQAVADPSLLVPATEAWDESRQGVFQPADRAFNPREHLLLSLGQAAGLGPRIEESLRTAAPTGYTTDEVGAYEFLSDTAAALEQAGFGVLLPAWWTRKGTKLRLQARGKAASPEMQVPGTLSLGSIVEFNWEVALGDQTLSRKELEALARLKTPLVRLRGQWVHMSREEIQAALDFWKQREAEPVTARDVLHMALGLRDAPGGLPVSGVAASGWLGELLGRLQGSTSFEVLSPPGDLRADLRPYQLRGYSWLSFLKQWGFGACLADDMGLGKTLQALALIQREWASNGKQPVLLVCPTSVVGNWQREAARFTPDLPVMVHHGVKRQKGEAFVTAAGEHALVVSSYALLHRDLAHLQQVKWAGVILDEAQNIKNAGTKQSRAARALPADYRIALTGTPVENNVGDLWSLMEFLNPGLLGSQKSYREQYLLPIQAGYGPDAAARLKRVTSPFILRRLKTDRSIIADLPEKMEMKVFCTLTKEQASLYQAVTGEVAAALEGKGGMERRGLVLAALARLKQVCNHPAHFLGDNSPIPGRSGKLTRLTEMVEEILAMREAALIFTQFTEMGHLLVRHLQETFGQEVIFLHGGVSKKRRDEMVARFQEGEGGPPLFVLSLKAGGTGLNLTRANHVFHFDRWWNPAVENQATDRAFRIGQTRDVQVHKFLCAGTMEERIDEMIEKKQAISEQVVGTGEAWLTELSTDELKGLFALGEGAVAE